MIRLVWLMHFAGVDTSSYRLQVYRRYNVTTFSKRVCRQVLGIQSRAGAKARVK